MDCTMARSGSGVLSVVGQVEIALHSPSAIAASEVVQDVEIAVLALRNKDVEFKVVVAVLFITKQQDVVINTRDESTFSTVHQSDDTVFSATRSIAPSRPPIMTYRI